MQAEEGANTSILSKSWPSEQSRREFQAEEIIDCIAAEKEVVYVWEAAVSLCGT